MKEARNPASIHAPVAPYSHQIELRERERLLVLSGQVGMAPDGRIPEDPADQLEVALENVVKNLEAAGMDAGDLVKLTFYCVEPIDPDRRRTALRERLGEHQPCMTMLYVSALSVPALKVELDAWASAEDSLAH